MYKFQLKWSSVIGVTSIVTCFPRYSNAQIVAEGISKRISFVGDLEFCGVDFDNIIAAPLLTKFYVIIKEGPVTIYTGYFTYEMMEVNYDAKIIKTTLKTDDFYERISQILDKEINLSDIDCKKVTTTFYSPILHQVYVLGDNECTCYCGGTSWKQECEIIENSVPLPHNCGLGRVTIGGFKYWQNSEAFQIACPLGNYGFSQPFIMRIDADGVQDFGAFSCKTFDGAYELKLVATDGNKKLQFQVFLNGVMVWYSNKKNINEDYTEISDFTFTNVTYGYTTQFSPWKRVFVRTLTNNTSYTTFDDEIARNDNFFTKNFMYDYVSVRINTSPDRLKKMTIYASKNTQITENNYQKSSTGGYFVKPLNTVVGYKTASSQISATDSDYEYKPVGQRVWSNFSIWFKADDAVEAESITYKGTHEVKSFTLIETIKAIFNYFDIKLNVKSDFFYLEANPISGLARKYPCLTQFSNMHVKDGVFATRNIISLGEILQFLKDRFNIEWSVKDNYFRLEHIYFYENNEKYKPNKDFIDLTTKEASRLEKMWSELQNTCTFDIEHYREWLFTEKNASDYLESGIIKTEYTTSENTRKSESSFYTDVNRAINADFKEGWFFGMYDTSYRFEFDYVSTYKGTKVQLQNIYCMLPLCMEQYFGFNDYGTNVKVNGVNQAVRGFFRPKIQEIEVPYGGEPLPNFYKLVKTSQGIGFCKKIVVNLVQKVVKYTLKHEK